MLFLQSIRRDQILNIPNMLTMLRIALLPIIIWRFRLGDLRGALVFYLAAMITDAADGLLARRLNQITSLGKLLDPLADKLSLLTLLMLFAQEGQISTVLLRLVFVRELILIIGSAAALRTGIVVSALPIGKLTTFVFIISMTSRFLAYDKLADISLWSSVLLSFAALLWYSVVLLQKLYIEKIVL